MPLGKTIESKDYSHGISGEEAVTTVRHGKYSSADPEKEDDSVEPSPHMLLQTPRQDRNEIANSRESLQDAALRDAKSIEVYANDKFDAAMARGESARSQISAQTRMSSELLTMEAGDIRLNATVDRAGKVVHQINADRLSRYETVLANTLTDSRPPSSKRLRYKRQVLQVEHGRTPPNISKYE